MKTDEDEIRALVTTWAGMRTTRLQRHLHAPPDAVYRALVDADAVQDWKVPTGMRSEVHQFEPREGGRFRVSLTYEEPGSAGKTRDRTDTYHGQFLRLIPDRLVVEVTEFETADPALRGEMRITYELTEAVGGTDLVATHANVPPGVRLEDNELGWSLALDKLAAWLARNG